MTRSWASRGAWCGRRAPHFPVGLRRRPSLFTTQSTVTHNYASAGAFAVTLTVNDGQLDSAPFTTQVTIGVPGRSQQDDVGEFLAYVQPVKPDSTLPAGTTSFNVVIIYGPTIDPSTFNATLNHPPTPFTGFHLVPNTSETVTIPLTSGKNSLTLEVQDLREDGKTDSDKDELTFKVP